MSNYIIKLDEICGKYWFWWRARSDAEGGEYGTERNSHHERELENDFDVASKESEDEELDDDKAEDIGED